MKLKELQGILGSLNSFEKPKVNLEQYQTSAEIAAVMFHTMSFGDDIKDKVVVDLGCGCGTLAIGASLLGASHCFGFDVDEDAISICAENMNNVAVDNIDLIMCDVTSALPSIISENFGRGFDVAVMNPPFGTKNNEGIDVKFLRAAVALKCGTIYSMHKTSTRQHMMKVAKNLDLKADVFAQLRFDLPATMRFHKKKNVDIEVDLIRVKFYPVKMGSRPVLLGANFKFAPIVVSCNSGVACCAGIGAVFACAANFKKHGVEMEFAGSDSGL